jgi:hypothetical protein
MYGAEGLWRAKCECSERHRMEQSAYGELTDNSVRE